MKRICLLTTGILTLSACDNAAKHQSTGFSGLGSEPTVAQADYLDPRLNTGTLYSDVPSRAVRSGSANRADHAELVIRKASGSGWRSKVVTVGGQPLALSVLYVNTIPYAVLKPKSGLFTPDIVPETSAAFGGNAAQLTGCPAASQVYAVGPRPNRPQGLTMALACAG